MTAWTRSHRPLRGQGRRPKLEAKKGFSSTPPPGFIGKESVVMLLPSRFTRREQAASDFIYRLLLHTFVLAMLVAVATAALLK